MKNGFTEEDFAEDEAARYEPAEWHDEALEYHKQGYSTREIAEEVGVSHNTVAKFLRRVNAVSARSAGEMWRERVADLDVQGFAPHEIAEECDIPLATVAALISEMRGNEIDLRTAHDESEFVEEHKPRTIRPVLVPKRAKNAAIAAFARGEIDRAELMRRISYAS